MDDRTMMDTILSSVKGACDLMMHGTIESSTPQVHSAFDAGLQKCLCMQNEIYSKMSQKGWYPSTQVEQTKIDQAESNKNALKKLTPRSNKKMPTTKHGMIVPTGPLVSVPQLIRRMASQGIPLSPFSYHL